jgi:hypothetical protein
MATETDKLVLDFLLGFIKIQLDTRQDDQSIDDILKFTEEDIEKEHKLIQWIFPTMERSHYNSKAPLISGDFKNLFLENPKARETFCKSCQMYLNFIGFECVQGKIRVLTTKNAKMFYERNPHNFLRITRVLDSLNQIGKPECSKNVFSELKRIYPENPSLELQKSFVYWKNTQRL